MDKKTAGASLFSVYGRYAVVRLLGEGGMGRVYLAQDPVLQRHVALKVIPVDQHVERATREDYLKRFAVEAKALAQLNHQSIVKVYDAGEERGVPWIAFEFVEGETLEAVLHRKIKLPLSQALRIALDIGAALGHAHAKKIIHRDIKPANILIEQGTGIAKLTDFGVAKAPWAMLTQTGNALGSPGYMSPEQIEGYELDERSDFFGLGVVLYQMLSGSHPFVRDTVASTAFATVSGSYIPLRELVTGIPAEIEKVIDRCLAPRKEDRIASAEFIERLWPLVHSAPAAAEAPAIAGAGATRDAKKEPLRLGESVLSCARAAARGMRMMAGFAWNAIGAIKRRIPRSGKVSPPGTPNILAWTLKKTLRTMRQWRMLISRPRMTPGRQNCLITWLTVALFAAAAIAAIAGICWARSRVTYEDALMAGLNPSKYCSSWPPAKTAAACRLLLQKNNVPLADSIAAYLAKTRKSAAVGAALKGRIALRAENFKDARASFAAAASAPGGKRVLRKEREAILAEFKPKLAKFKSPQQFIDIMTELLGAGDSPSIRSWTGAKEYWLRWNSVRILQAAKKRVDMAAVYIMDLGLGNSMRTRIEAAEQLGELKDKRAIPHLRKAAAKGWRDPFVAAAAREALQRFSAQ